MEIRIYTEPWSTRTKIGFFKEKDGKHYMAKPMVFEFEEYNPMTVINDSTLNLSYDEAHEFLTELSNALNQAGFVSKNVDGYQSELKATKYHLEDMRALAFKNKE